LWNPFKKKDRTAAPEVANRVEDLADSLHQDGRAGELESELQKFDQGSLSDQEQRSWWHLYGITAFQRGDHVESLERFLEGYKRYPDSPQIRFSLGQQYERTGNLDEAFRLFSEGQFPELPRDFVLAQARYAYLWDRYEHGRKFLVPFFDAYKKLKILDDHFLYVRGVPFFGTAWSYLAAFSLLSGEWDELEAVTRYAEKHCRSYDFDEVKLELRAHREDRPELLIPSLEKGLRLRADSKVPNGYFHMNIAVAQARLSTSASEAEAVINKVWLMENDLKWLEDIRTLAKAEIAHRFAQPEVEQERIAEFLQRQPMLFEPDIALSFHLLKYQEGLKPRYREQRPRMQARAKRERDSAKP
jgi:tetratricopeptide (TPR) repeat protein